MEVLPVDLLRVLHECQGEQLREPLAVLNLREAQTADEVPDPRLLIFDDSCLLKRQRRYIADVDVIKKGVAVTLPQCGRICHLTIVADRYDIHGMPIEWGWRTASTSKRHRFHL